MPCLEPDGVLEYLQGELDADRTSDLEEHMAGCAACRRLVATLVREGVVSLQGDGGGTPVDPADPPVAADDSGRLPSLVGQTVGNYVLERQLGRGAMGTVYLGRHPEIGRAVAIKVLDSHVDEVAAARFVDEATAVTWIAHPNVIEVYDLGRTDTGWIYYVMELLDGRHLGQHMQQRFEDSGRMSAAEVTPLLQQICAGLQATHAQGVVHRDLKPENIFLLSGDSLRVKLLDYGIAKLLNRHEALTLAGAVVGSPVVISPEQARGDLDQVGPPSDIYALGVVLYWMLAGRPPFAAHSITNLLAAHASRTPRSLELVTPGLPRPLVRVVMQCLEKAPGDRPASAAEVAQRFGA
jgi:serine/threonine-protein kinase